MRKVGHKCIKSNCWGVCGSAPQLWDEDPCDQCPTLKRGCWPASSCSKIQKSELFVTAALSPVLISSHTLSILPGMPSHSWVVTQKTPSIPRGCCQECLPCRKDKSCHYHHTYKLVPRTPVKSLWNFNDSNCAGSDSISPKSGRVLGKSQVSNPYTLNEQKDASTCRRNLLNVLVINRKTSILELFCNLLFCTLNFFMYSCVFMKTHTFLHAHVHIFWTSRVLSKVSTLKTSISLEGLKIII